MLRIALNLHPHGSRLGKTLNNIEIINIGTGTLERGNYEVGVAWFEDEYSDPEHIERIVVTDFDRDKGALALLYEALKQMDEKGVLCRKSAGQSEEQITHSMKH